MNKGIFFLLALVMMVTSCKTGKIGQRSKLQVSEITCDYFSSKAKLKYDDGELNVGATAHIRLNAGDSLYVNISKSGFSAMRVLFTQDSAFLVNKLERWYQVVSYKEVSKMAGTTLTFAQIEDILFGNSLIPLQKGDKFKKGADATVTIQERDGYRVESTLGKSSNKLKAVKLSREDSNDELRLEYGDFKEVDSKLLATLMKMHLEMTGEESKTMDISLEHTKPHFSEKPVKISFAIPSSYERK